MATSAGTTHQAPSTMARHRILNTSPGRFVYVVTAAGVEALRQSAAAFDSEREAPLAANSIALDTQRSDAHD